MASSLARVETLSPVEKSNLDGDVVESGTTVPDENDDEGEFLRKTLRKVDLRLLPILGAMSALSIIDRINLSNIQVSGADKEIGLGQGNHYSLATLAFFVPYIILEIPSNMVFRRVGASRFLSTTGVLWGLVIICMGFVRNSSQLAALRGLLGILESGFVPACIWLISSWYKRSEVQVRMAAFSLISTLFGSFSSVIAYGLSTIKADHISGWRWILIIEGIMTCALSIMGYFFIVDFPDKNKFLTKEQTDLITARIDQDRGDTDFDLLTVRKCMEYACDLKLWSFGVAGICLAMAGYAYGYFIVIVLVGLGYSVKDAQLLSTPLGLIGCVVAICLSKLADKWKMRAPFIVLQTSMVICGLGLTGFHSNNHVRFAACFLGVAGLQANVPALLAYQSNNIRGQSKRSFASALQAGLGAFGGIITSIVFRQKDAPTYKFGIAIAIGLQFLIIVLTGLNSMWFAHCNRQARKGLRTIEGQQGFLYTL